LSSSTTPLTRTLDRVAWCGARISDGSRRVRYRRAELRRISPALQAAEPGAPRNGGQWLPPVRVGARSCMALETRAGSHVAYDVSLPPGARIGAWCALMPGDEAHTACAIEFAIRVEAQGFESTGRCTVSVGTSPTTRRWHPLRVHAPADGPARIVLTALAVGGADAGDVRVLWGDPCIEVPRPLADLLARAWDTVTVSGVRGLLYGALPAGSDRLYRLWVRENEPSREALQAQRQWSLGRPQLFSLVTFIAEHEAWRPERTAASLREQSYPGWEWIVVATGPPSRPLGNAGVWMGSDPRVRIVTVPVSSTLADAWNTAFNEVRGEFAAVLGADDVLAHSALYEMATALERTPDCDVLYSDEDCVTRHSRRHQPRFKPDWSPELLLSSNYIGRLAMLRVAAVRSAGGFRSFDGCEEWDLLLRLSRSGARVRRLPRCLYHRCDVEGGRSADAEASVLRDHCEALGLAGSTVTTRDGLSRAIWPLHAQPKVSIVIPNRNSAAVLRQCVGGLLERTRYPHRELVIVDNGSTEPEVLDLYRVLDREGASRIVPFDRPFNFPAACTVGASEARGELLLFLNNDVEVIEPEWLDELVRWALRPDVGVVGAKLLYPDRTIQHAGVVFGLGLVGHIFSRAPEGASGVFGSPESYRNYLAVTGACQMMRRKVFERLGGYDERFRISFSDVVFCMEARRAGYRIVYTPYARLIHHESHTRKRDDSAQDMELLARYLRSSAFIEDPYLHPELNPKSLVPALRPPFGPLPRQVVHDYVERVLEAAAAAH
jgi:GT2 family glycosyltransferase